MAHRHEWRFEKALVSRTGAIEVSFACERRGCKETHTKTVKIRKPAPTAITDKQREAAKEFTRTAEQRRIDQKAERLIRTGLWPSIEDRRDAAVRPLP